MATADTKSLGEWEDYFKDKLDFHTLKVDFYTKKLEAIKILKQPEGTDVPEIKKDSVTLEDNKNIKLLDVPNEYSITFTHKEKVYFALREIGSGLNKDVAIKLAQLEPGLGKIKKIVTTNLDILRRDGNIKSEKIREKLSKFYIK